MVALEVTPVAIEAITTLICENQTTKPHMLRRIAMRLNAVIDKDRARQTGGASTDK